MILKSRELACARIKCGLGTEACRIKISERFIKTRQNNRIAVLHTRKLNRAVVLDLFLE